MLLPTTVAAMGRLSALLGWWTYGLWCAASGALSKWSRAPEWPLLVASRIFVASFLIHALGFLLARAGVYFEPTEWEGRTGWRKPMLFGISNAMVFCALAKALGSQRLVPRSIAAHTAAWATIVEVGIITLQAWRGQPSHFNTSTPTDALLYAIKLAGVTVLGAICFATTAGCVLRPAAHAAPDCVALKLGMGLLSVSCAVGFANVAYGHLQAQVPSPWSPAPLSEGATERLCRGVTAGVHGAPCYEVHGEAVIRILHFVPLHSTEALLVLSWASRHAGLSERHCVTAVRTAAAGLASLTAGTAWQVAHGGKLSLPGMGGELQLLPVAALAVRGGSLAVIAAFATVALAPLLLPFPVKQHQR